MLTPKPLMTYNFFDTAVGPALLGVHIGMIMGVRYLFFGSDEASLLEEAEKRFPNAPHEKSRMLDSWGDAIAAAIADPNKRRGRLFQHMAVGLSGTDFQMKVWKAIDNTSPGQTIQYGEIAKMIGSPRSYRAVAQACGANPVAFIIPCHRVVPKKGLGGYHWGQDIKRNLLRLENPEENV